MARKDDRGPNGPAPEPALGREQVGHALGQALGEPRPHAATRVRVSNMPVSRDDGDAP